MIAAAIIWLRQRGGLRTREPPPTVDDLRVELVRMGLEAQVEERTVVGGAIVGWVVTVTLATPVASFFAALGAAAGKAAGKDAYAAFRTWLHGQRARTCDSGVVIVKGSDDREVELELPVPEEALDALRELDWQQMPTGSMMWDRQTRCWRPESAESD